MVDTAQFPPGEMLDEKYRIDRLLSVGGMGAVYVGTHVLLKKKVAIKVLRTELAGADNMVERFQREAEAASAIGHDNIVSVTDMGKTRGGVAFLVMELLAGRSLAQAIRDDGPLPMATSCDVACEILGGVGAAHRAGIVHRDLKPENVYLARREGRGEVVKILDFGISSFADASNPDHRLTMTGVVLGTPYYMAPEQARGDREVPAAVDVYSTGVILYEMLTRGLPYEAENYNLLVFRILSGDYIRMSQRRSDLPKALEAIVDRAMALDVKDRFPTADEFLAALKPYRSNQTGSGLIQVPARTTPATVTPAPVTDREISVAETLAQPTPAPFPRSSPGLAPPAPPPRRRAWPKLLAALAAGAVAAAIAYVVVVKKQAPAGGTQASEVRPETPASRAESPAPAPAAAAAPAPAPAPAAVPAPPAPEPVVLDFVVQPRDAKATITVDGKPLAGTSYTTAKSDLLVTVRIEAPGYESFENEYPLDRNQSVVVPLTKERQASGNRGKKDKPPRVIERRQPDEPEPIGTKDPKRTDKIVTDSPYGP